MESLKQRVAALELDLGTQSTQMAQQIAELQAHFVKLCASNEEYGTLNSMIDSLPRPAIIDETHDQQTMQELLLAKIPFLLDAHNQLMELQAIDFPEFSEHTMRLCLPDEIVKREAELRLLQVKIHAQVVKNLVIFERFSDLVERETLFWKLTQRRLTRLSSKHPVL